jgi:hypothetical protein
MVTHEYSTEGPVQPLFSTTKEEIDEELLNRCLLLTSNITREQTHEIHKLQREKETLDGMVQVKERERIIKLHQNAQRLLRPILVVNPYAPHLTFLDSKLRTRRDHAKYLTLIKTIALLHQYQRVPRHEVRNGQVYEYIEVTLDDIALANRLAGEIMGISLDELAPQTRKFLGLILEMVKNRCDKEQIEQSQYYFTRREVREFSGWSNTQIKIHLDRLQDMEYLLAHRGKGQGQQYAYELVYKGEGEERERFLMGLVDVEALRRRNGNGKYDGNFAGVNGNFTEQKANFAGEKGNFSPSLRAENGVISPSFRSEKSPSMLGKSSETANNAEKREKRI